MKLEQVERVANMLGSQVHARLGAEVALFAFRGHRKWLRNNRGSRALSEEGQDHIRRVGKIVWKIDREVGRGTLPESILDRLRMP